MGLFSRHECEYERGVVYDNYEVARLDIKNEKIVIKKGKLHGEKCVECGDTNYDVPREFEGRVLEFTPDNIEEIPYDEEGDE